MPKLLRFDKHGKRPSDGQTKARCHTPRIRYAGIECAVDLEAEARPRAEMARRLFEYGTRSSVVTGLPVISVVLWLQSGNVPPSSPYELRVGDLLLAAWHFIGIALYDLDAQALFTQGLVGLLPLVPFTRNGGDVATNKQKELSCAYRRRLPAD